MNGFTEYKSLNVYVAFRRAVKSFMRCARMDLRAGKFKKMNHGQKCDVGRALANLDMVAANPSKFFAPDYTEDAWRNRAKSYAQDKGLKSVADAYYCVESPATLVWQMAKDLQISSELYSEFYRLCDDFMQWEYRRVSDVLGFGFSTPRYAEAVVQHLEFFRNWESNNAGVCEQWRVMKKQNSFIKSVRQKVRELSR